MERTQLAWQRYTLALAIVAVLSLRAGVVGDDEVAAFVIAFLLGALAAALQFVGPRANPRRAVRLVLAASLTAAMGSLVLGFL